MHYGTELGNDPSTESVAEISTNRTFTVYIWLKKSADAQLESLQKEGLLGDVWVDRHRHSGKKYIHVYEDFFDPTSDVSFSEELIEKVTIRNRINRGFRTEGIYRHEGATLMVKTEIKVHSEGVNGRFEREEWQEISIVAPTVEKLRAIYTLVRQNKLAPEENWDDSYNSSLPPASVENEVETTA